MSDLDGIPMAVVQRLRAEGAAAEREACAKVAEAMCRCDPVWAKYGRCDPSCGAHDIADVIRARGEPASPVVPTHLLRPGEERHEVARAKAAAPCPTCGGRRKVHRTMGDQTLFDEPCPDCAPKPDAKCSGEICDRGGFCPAHTPKPDAREWALKELSDGLLALDNGEPVRGFIEAAIAALEGK